MLWVFVYPRVKDNIGYLNNYGFAPLVILFVNLYLCFLCSIKVLFLISSRNSARVYPRLENNFGYSFMVIISKSDLDRESCLLQLLHVHACYPRYP